MKSVSLSSQGLAPCQSLYCQLRCWVGDDECTVSNIFSTFPFFTWLHQVSTIAKPNQTKNSIHSLSSSPQRIQKVSWMKSKIVSCYFPLGGRAALLMLTVNHQHWLVKHERENKTHLKRGSASVTERKWCLWYCQIHPKLNCVMPVLAESKRRVRREWLSCRCWLTKVKEWLEENSCSWSGLALLLLLTVRIVELPSHHAT